MLMLGYRSSAQISADAIEVAIVLCSGSWPRAFDGHVDEVIGPVPVGDCIDGAGGEAGVALLKANTSSPIRR
jgi:hypothetical protein